MATFKESLTLPTVGHLRNQSLASGASTQTTGLWTKAGKARKYAALCSVGALNSGTCTFQFYGATDADGTSAAAIAGTLVLDAAGEVGWLYLDSTLILDAKPFISVVCTTANGTGICGAVVVQFDPAFSG